MAEAPINPNMVIVSLVVGDHWLGQRCPSCLHPYRVHEEIFESLDQKTSIHVSCVVALALVASLRDPIPRTADA